MSGGAVLRIQYEETVIGLSLLVAVSRIFS
jgi:hypothetical protein